MVHKAIMDFEQLKGQAERLGFKFEWREWIPDGYVEDEAGNVTKRLITKKETAWKVTFPPDYPRPSTMIGVSTEDEVSILRSLQHALNEYNRREEIWAENKRVSEENVRAMRLFKLLNKLL